jgi:integrase
VALLRRMREERQEASPFLFPGDAIGKPLRTVKTAWHTFCRDAGLEGVRIHDLRHTSVSLLVNSGVGLHLAGRLAGHRQSRTTERYAHTADSALRDASARLGSLVEGITTAAETTRDGESGAEEG